MYNGNSRFTMLPNNVLTELISFQTQLFYDPTTQGCRVIFNGAPYMQIPQEGGGVSYMKVGEMPDLLHIDLMPKMTNIVGRPGDTDPVTGASLAEISVYGVLVLMKRAYDNMHNERAAEIAAELAAAEAAAAAAEEPPAEEPPAEEPPAEQPPAEEPPPEEPAP